MTYLYPFPAGTRISQRFGSGPNTGANGPGGHTGIDYAVQTGTPVRAAADGIIELSSWVSENYADNPWWLTQMGGDNLVLNCGSGRPSFIYAHLSDSIADVGQTVRKGQVIAYTGNTGTATTGPHCHVEALPPGYVLNSATYGRVDPEHFFDEYWDENSIEFSGAITIDPIDDPLIDEDNMKVIATNGKDGKVYIGDYILRRHIWTMDTKQGIDYMQNIGAAGPLYKNGEIQTIPDLNVIGIDVESLAGKATK